MSKSEYSDRQFFDQLARLEAETVAKIRAATADLPENSAEARAARRERARQDRAWALGHYFPHLCDEPAGPELQRYLDERAAALAGTGLLTLEAHRGFGKSTLENLALTVLELAEGTSKFTVITGDTDKLTVPTVLQCRLEFEANERLRQDFGDQAFGQVWQQGWFILRNGRECKGLSVEQGIRGQRGAVHNRRPDRWKLDDFQDDKLARNPERVAERLAVIEAKIIPAMAKAVGTLVIATGHPLTHDCCMMRLRARESWHHFAHWIATDLETLTPTNPERFPQEWIVQIRRKVGTLVFNREYMGIAVKPDAVFRPEWMRAYRRPQVDGLPLVVALYMDPAISSKGKGGDYKAVVMDGLHVETGDEYCLGAFIRRMCSPRELCKAFWGFAQEALRNEGWVLHLGFEDNGFQALMGYPLDAVRRELGLPDLGIQGITNTKSKDMRVEALAPKFENGHMHFDQEHSDQELLVQQLLYWPDAGLDGPDTLRGCHDLLVRAAGGAHMAPSAVPGIGARQRGEVW